VKTGKKRPECTVGGGKGGEEGPRPGNKKLFQRPLLPTKEGKMWGAVWQEKGKIGKESSDRKESINKKNAYLLKGRALRFGGPWGEWGAGKA